MNPQKPIKKPDNHNVNLPAQQQIITQVQREYSGPLPPADEMQKYENILPGISERLVAMAEKNNTTRNAALASEIKIKETESNETLRAIARGQRMSYSISLSIIGVSIWLISIGQPIAGSTLLGGTLASVAALVWKFMSDKKTNS